MSDKNEFENLNEDDHSEVEILSEIDEYVYCVGDYIELGSLVDNIGGYHDEY